MQEINWNNFKTKFNGKEQRSFEWLSLLLFCDEFKLNTGVFRYKNQAGIETEPIEHDGKWIGFQAKFYETKISENKDDIKDSITKAKIKNPKLNKVLFYINKEFSESSNKDKKEPAYKTEIENYAKSKSIELEWKVPSHFEVQLALEKNSILAQHFFSLNKSVIDFIGELKQHTESILKTIHSKIIFHDNEIKIDRSKIVEKLRQTLDSSSLVIVSGEAGVGKTAVIKDFYDFIKDTIPFFAFKATELNIFNINELFKSYGDFTLSDFIKEHEDINEKYIIIDSAEKLSDIEHKEVFEEFLSTLIDANWKIIFTTRHGYLDDLKYQCIEFFKLNFQLLNIVNLTTDELAGFSETFNFRLPNSERLCEILHNPFYLNEYLQIYGSIDAAVSYSDFKNILWNKQISKSSYRKNNTHIKREDCFLKIAIKRANDGHFLVKADDCEDEILHKLQSDEIIKYESNSGGYFITHDIYEEWALDKAIERAFHNSEDYKAFYREIGSSLAIRRAFRSWLSERLFIKREEVKSLIETTTSDDEIESYWKDEILVSVLLSNYSEKFIQLFEKKLLEDNQKLIVRIVFLLRIACKEIDESILSLLSISKIEGPALKTLFTKPKGDGWGCVINFINNYKKEFGLKHINTILPLLDDWNNKNRQGKTTKNASQISLFYYDEITKNDGFDYSYRSETQKIMIRTILNGSFEVKEELKNIFNEVLSKKEINHRSKYYALIQTSLSSAINSSEIAKNLPEQVISLGSLFWFQIPDKKNWRPGDRIDVEQDFCLREHHHDYFPASALQTPIYTLLRFAPKQAIDFILSFINKTVECYSKSTLKNEAEEVEVFIDEKKSIKQHISNRLWNMYRGTQMSSQLLESMHMALEKWLLEYAKSESIKNIESQCFYLIKNSKSASITAVVASVVLAHPSKLFNIAKILFQTKEFFLYDTNRMMLDQTAKSHYSLGYGFNYEQTFFEKERIITCDEPHRKLSLENIALNYQFFRIKGESVKDAENRSKIIWKIFDKYYEKIPNKDKETDSDKTWRLYLARMDRRKMSLEIEEKDGKTLIKFNPEIDPELKKHSEDSKNESSALMKYTSLKLWSDGRFRREENKYKQYQQYETNPQLVIKETKEIIEGLKNCPEENFSLFNHSIPAYTCSVLICDFFDKLNKEDKNFCKEVIIVFASTPLKVKHYHYQISDGTEPSIIILAELIKHFPKDKEEIKMILCLLLLNPWREISTFAIRSVLHRLWGISFEDAHSFFLGYLLLKPKYKNLSDEIRKKNYKKNIYELSEKQLLERFRKKYEKELGKIISNSLTYDELIDLETLDLGTLITAFELLPHKIEHKDHKKFLTAILPVFSKKLFQDDDKVDYVLKHRFLNKFACFILNSTKNEIETYLRPFIDNFISSRDMADFFKEFVTVEDRLNKYEEFWTVWNAFYDKITEICKNQGFRHYTKEILHNYLLAGLYWKEDAKEWHTLKDREKLFFKNVANDIGHHPSVLYSLSKILNDIGSNFIDDGIIWIRNILEKNKNMFSKELDVNTIYYIENLVRRYILTNRQRIKRSKQIKNQVIVILNFLLEKGSVTGYLLREDIL